MAFHIQSAVRTDLLAGIAADVVAAWHGHTERMTQAVYGSQKEERFGCVPANMAPDPIVRP
jgi:hypothetical protein